MKEAPFETVHTPIIETSRWRARRRRGLGLGPKKHSTVCVRAAMMPRAGTGSVAAGRAQRLVKQSLL